MKPFKPVINDGFKIDPQFQNAVPELTEGEYQDLKASIEADGLMYPILCTHDGRVIDGHHRLRACEELGIAATGDALLEESDDNFYLKMAIDLNVKRRQLTPQQRRELAIDSYNAGKRSSEVGKIVGLKPSALAELKKSLKEEGLIKETASEGTLGAAIKRKQGALEIRAGAPDEEIKRVHGFPPNVIKGFRKQVAKEQQLVESPEQAMGALQEATTPQERCQALLASIDGYMPAADKVSPWEDTDTTDHEQAGQQLVTQQPVKPLPSRHSPFRQIVVAALINLSERETVTPEAFAATLNPLELIVTYPSRVEKAMAYLTALKGHLDASRENLEQTEEGRGILLSVSKEKARQERRQRDYRGEEAGA